VTGRIPDRAAVVPAVNYVRIPVMASGLLFLVFFPGIIRQGKGAYYRATGLTQAPYLGRWLLITAVLFGLSAAAYAVRLILIRRTPTGEPPSEEANGGEYL
jgi:hypothetical protein